MSLNVAVIGTGWAHRVQIPAFQAAGLKIVGLAGRDPEKTKRIAAEHGVPFHTANWRDVLSLDCELVSVTSPPALHKEQGIAVLEAGKHLLCEKPLALNLQEAEALWSSTQARPAQHALLDHELRFTPARKKAKEIIDSGRLGTVLSVTARVALSFRADEKQPWSWWSDAAQGGGILGAIGSHVFDGIRWLLGEVEVHGATLGRAFPERNDSEGVKREVTADDIASVTFSANGAVGTVLVHGVAQDLEIDQLTVRGAGGTLVIENSTKLYVGIGKQKLKEYVTRVPDFVPNRFRSSPYSVGTVLLARALERGLVAGDVDALGPAATVADGVAVQKILDEVRRRAVWAR